MVPCLCLYDLIIMSTFYFHKIIRDFDRKAIFVHCRNNLVSVNEVRPLRILLAEDQIINQKLCQKILNGMGHEVDIASDGEEAIQLWNNGDYDLILMDVQMPGTDGIRAVQVIRESELRQGAARTPIIALTAYGMKNFRESLISQGFDSYISKPIDIDILKDELCRVSRKE